MVVDGHHEVVNGVGVREYADLAADGSIFFLLALLAMEILGEFHSCFLLFGDMSQLFSATRRPLH